MLKKLALATSVTFSLLLLASLISYVIWFNLTNDKYVQLSRQNEETPLAGALIPSQVLAGQAGYNRQKITLRGRVSPNWWFASGKHARRKMSVVVALRKEI